MDGIEELISGIDKLVHLLTPSKYWHCKTYTYTDTKEHENEFIDSHTGKKFKSRHIIIKAPSTNTGDINIRFTKAADWDIYERSESQAMDLKEETTFYLKLDTANDKVRIIAW